MRRLIAPEDMRRSEKLYFENAGVASIDIMENAARSLADLARARYPGAAKIYIACGPGGNGGDGYACARLLKEAGLDLTLFAAAPARSADTIENARRAREAGIPILGVDELETLPAPDLWIDCLYGTGLSRAPEGEAAILIRWINADREQGAGVIAADIPSGLNGRTGRAYDPCVQADLTSGFQIAKYGHFLQDGLDLCGEIVTPDVGFPANAFPWKLPQLLETEDLKRMFAPRRRNIHKGTCGHLLIIAGSTGMAGAAAQCAQAALRSGVGLVSIACPENIVPILQTIVPCAMCVPLPEKNGAISKEALPALKAAFVGKSALVIGCGLSRAAAGKIISAALDSKLPAVVDADALNLIAEKPELRRHLKPHHILTPHPGEAARLLGRPCADPMADAAELAETGATVVLKGASRVICDHGECFISAAGSSALARAGSGDILAGIMGALLAEKSGRSTLQTAAAACELHGLAGKAAGEKYGLRAVNSADLISFLPEVFKAHVE